VKSTNCEAPRYVIFSFSPYVLPYPGHVYTSNFKAGAERCNLYNSVTTRISGPIQIDSLFHDMLFSIVRLVHHTAADEDICLIYGRCFNCRGFIASNGRIVVNDHLGRMWKEVVVTYLKTLNTALILMATI